MLYFSFRTENSFCDEQSHLRDTRTTKKNHTYNLEFIFHAKLFRTFMIFLGFLAVFHLGLNKILVMNSHTHTHQKTNYISPWNDFSWKIMQEKPHVYYIFTNFSCISFSHDPIFCDEQSHAGRKLTI